MAKSESIWIPDPADDVVLQINKATGSLVNEITVGRQPIGAVFVDGALWVANRRDDTVSRIEPDTLDVGTVRIGGAPTGIAVAGDSIWVTVTP